MYYQDFYIHTYEVDKNKRLLVSALLNYFQDAMVHNADMIGVGSDYTHNIGQLWVLIDYEIDMVDLPFGKTIVTCGTTPHSIKRFFSYRVWEMKDANGKLIASAKGKFVLMDIVSKEIVSPGEEMIELFNHFLNKDATISFSKNNPLNSEVIYRNTDKVKNTYIDINKHMNNVYYMTVAYNNIPRQVLSKHYIKKIRITYKKECLEDDLLTIEGRRDENLLYYEILSEGKLLSKVSFTLEEIEKI